MKTTYAGLDYGHGMANVDTKTGIRFGVIPQNDVLDVWAEESEPVYSYYCPHCGTELKKGQDAKRCPSCYKKIDANRDFAFMEPDCYIYLEEGYKCSCGENGDIFIEESPYFTYAQFCSPCAPGAGYLRNELEEKDPNNRTFCFGHDWFEGEKAPYTVYSVKTGEVVEPVK